MACLVPCALVVGLFCLGIFLVLLKVMLYFCPFIVIIFSGLLKQTLVLLVVFLGPRA